MNDSTTTTAEHDANNARVWIEEANSEYELGSGVTGQAPAQIASAIALADIADQLRRIADRLETADGRPS